MNDYFESLLQWISQYPDQAGWVIFAVACIESLAIVGAIVPGAIILFGAGALIGSGVLNFWDSCLWAIAGAIVGDGLSFMLGQRFEYLSNRWRWLRIRPDYLQQGIDFFQRYGDISIALGRFLGPTRAIVPLAAGMLQMSTRRFYIANILSAIVWAPAYLAPGILLGQSFQQDDWRFILLIFLLMSTLILVWLGLQHWRRKAIDR